MTSTSLLSNKIYNVIKWITALFIPALITLYLSLADVWNFPNPEKVVLTAAAVNVFLGVLLKVSDTQYKKYESAELSGYIHGFGATRDSETEDGSYLNFNMPYNLSRYAENGIVRFNVVPPGSSQGKHDL